MIKSLHTKLPSYSDFCSIDSTRRSPGGPNREHALSTYTLSIEGLAEPTRFETLDVAIEALVAILQAAPIRPDRAEAYVWMIAGEGGLDRVRDFIARDGAFRLRFTADGQPFVAVIS
ncbi:hypothetical protein ACWDRR_42670 [Kitasatospora sp. NPDC003701]